MAEGGGGLKFIDGKEKLVPGEGEGRPIPIGRDNPGTKEDRGGSTDPGRIGMVPSKMGDGGTGELGFGGNTGPERFGRPVGEEEVGGIGAIGLVDDASGELAAGGGTPGEEEGVSTVTAGLVVGETEALENCDGADPGRSGGAPGEEEGASIVAVGLDGAGCCVDGEGDGDTGRLGLLIQGDTAGGLMDGDSIGEGEVLRSRRDSSAEGLER